MKKLFIGALTVLSIFGLAGCKSGKKLSAEEAKTELKAIAESTMKESNKIGSFKAKETFKASVSAKNIKAKMNDVATINFGSGKASAKFNTSINAKMDVANKKAQLSGSIDAGVNYSLKSPALMAKLGWDSESKSGDYSFKASADAYYVDSEEAISASTTLDVANIYGKYDAEVSKDLAELMESTETKFSGKGNFKTYDFAGFFGMFEADEDDDEDAFDFDFIQDWTIFTKSGNTITADCSNLEAFDLGYDLASTQTMLKKYGIDFKVSKFQIKVNKDNVITAFDFAMSVKGSANLAKVMADEDGESMYSGTISVDLSLGFGFELGYSEQSITVPEELTKLEAQDFDEIYEDFTDYIYDLDIMDTISGLIGGEGMPTNNSSVKKGNYLISAMKSVGYEAWAQASDDVTVTVDFGDTVTSNPTLKVLDGTTDKTSDWGFSSYDAIVEGLSAKGSVTIVINSETGKVSYSTNSFMIDGNYITINSNGECELAK